MAIKAAQLDRLRSQLLTSGLQQRDNPLWQVIDTLIQAARQSLSDAEALADASGGSSSTTTSSFAHDFLLMGG